MLGTGKRIDGCGLLHLHLFNERHCDHAGLVEALAGDLQLRQLITGNPNDRESFARDRFVVAYDRLMDLDPETAADPGVRALFGLLAGFEVRIGRVTYAARTFGTSLASRLYVLPAKSRRAPRHTAAAFTEFADVERHVQTLTRNAAYAARVAADKRARVAADKATFVNPLAVGAFVYASAGGAAYRFYRVLKVTRMGAVVRQCGTDSSSSFFTRPMSAFLPGAPQVRLRFRFRGGLTAGLYGMHIPKLAERVFLYESPIHNRSF